MKPCPFCGHTPVTAHAFVHCANPRCRLSYAAGTGNRSQGHRQPVLFTAKEWKTRPKTKNPK